MWISNIFFSGAFEVIFIVVFAIILVVFVAMLVSVTAQWRKNNRSPRLTVEAVVVAKRTDVTSGRHAVAGDGTGAHGYTYSTNTWYYATFQVESGDRMELELNGEEYGQLAEGDRGRLSFQGTRYLGFERAE